MVKEDTGEDEEKADSETGTGRETGNGGGRSDRTVRNFGGKDREEEGTAGMERGGRDKDEEAGLEIRNEKLGWLKEEGEEDTYRRRDLMRRSRNFPWRFELKGVRVRVLLFTKTSVNLI